VYASHAHHLYYRHVEGSDGKLRTLLGSPHYLAPDVVHLDQNPDVGYDSRADVWSLGTILSLKMTFFAFSSMYHITFLLIGNFLY